jgi:hypothetical protein
MPVVNANQTKYGWALKVLSPLGVSAVIETKANIQSSTPAHAFVLKRKYARSRILSGKTP